MSLAPYTHTALALVMMAIVGGTFRNAAIGATFASAFYYGREVSQAQTSIAKSLDVYRSSVWYRGWVDAALNPEFIFPMIVCCSIAHFLRRSDDDE